MRSVILPLGNKFRSWLANLRVLSSFLLGITIMLFYSSRYLTYIDEFGQAMQCFEPYIYVASHPRSFCFLILGGLLLLSDAPFLTPLSQQEMIRIGRKKWLIGQIVYIFIASFAYFAILELICSIYSSFLVETYLLGGWSDAMKILAIQQPQAVAHTYLVNFPYPQMVEAVSPNTVAALSILSGGLYLSLVSLMILAGNLIFKTNCGWIIGSTFHFVNYMIEANAGFGMNIKYSLICCSMLGYQFIPESGMSHAYCFGVILSGIFIIIGLCLINTNRIEPFEYN